jgi:hypothetical protein
MARTGEPDPPRTLSGNTMSKQKGGNRSRLFMVISHVDCHPDLQVHIRLAERGAFLQYDTPGRTKYQPEGTTIELMRRLFDAGYGKKSALGGTARGDRTGKLAAGQAWIICLPRLPGAYSRNISQRRK